MQKTHQKESAAFPKELIVPLCKPLTKQITKRRKPLYQSPLDKNMIYIKLFDTSNIIQIKSWVEAEFDYHANIDGILEEYSQTYVDIRRSASAQSFSFFLDNLPIMVVDITKAIHTEASMIYEEKEGDFLLNLLWNPKLPPGQASLVLKTAIRYFFFYPEVKRLIIEENEDPAIIKMAGFACLLKHQEKVLTRTLFSITKEQAAKDLAKKPATG